MKSSLIERDRTSSLLASALQADVLLMLTDVDAVYRDWGGPNPSAIEDISPDALDKMQFAEGSMGPKIAAGCEFARKGGTMAGIGSL